MFAGIIGFSIVMFIVILAAEVVLFALVIAPLCKIYTWRYPTTEDGLFYWYDLLSWIVNDSQSYNLNKIINLDDKNNEYNSNMITGISTCDKLTPFECSRDQDKIIRICCINHVVTSSDKSSPLSFLKNDKLQNYLDGKIGQLFLDVKLSHLRNHGKDINTSQFLPYFKGGLSYFLVESRTVMNG